MHRFACCASFTRAVGSLLLTIGFALAAPAQAQTPAADTAPPAATTPAGSETQPAAASPAPVGAPDPELEAARAQADEAGSALQAGRYAEAIKAYDSAYRTKPAPALLYNLGLAYKGAGYPAKALQAYEAYVGYADPEKDANSIANARTEIERLNTGYARFTTKLTPPEATIDIDGTRVTPDGGELWVPAGKHTIAIRASGFEAYEQTLDVVGGRFDLEVQLRAMTLPAADRAAQLVDEGIALEAAGDVNAALSKYQQAEAMQSTPRGLGQRGFAEEMVGRLPEAELHLKAAQAARRDKWVKKNAPKIRKALARINKELVTLTIGGSPDGTEVFVNGRSAGLLPIAGTVRALAGTVTVQGKKPGYAMFEELVDVPKRGKRKVSVTLEQTPPPVPLVVVWPEPPAPVVQAEPAPLEPIPLDPIPLTTEPEVAAVLYDDPDDDAVDEPTEELATGFEAALNFGYHPWIGGPELEGSSGTLQGQLLLGARLWWPFSFGLQINAGFDLANPGTKMVLAAHPGFYLRGHTQKHKGYMTFDVWGGVGVQPLSLQASVREPTDEALDPATVDPSLVNREDVVALIARREAGVDRLHTLQTINVPLELGTTFYFTPAFGIDLSMALTFWLPQQDCIHDGSDARFCTTDDLENQTSFFVGGGLSFLP